jgi:ferric iron reductase protein FhuF
LREVTVRHPFEATLARVGRVLPGIADHGPRLAVPREHPWTTLSALATPARLERLVERVRRREAGERRDVAAVWFLERLVEIVAGPTVAAVLLEERLLDLDTRTVAFRFGSDGYPVEWGVHRSRLRAGAAGPDELVAILRGQLEEGLAPVVNRLHVLGRRSSAALWRGCGDVLAAAFLAAGKGLQMVDRAVALGERCLAAPGPMSVPAGYTVVALDGGRRVVTRVRSGCCLNHVIEPGETCLPCPLTPAAERRRRLKLTNA